MGLAVRGDVWNAMTIYDRLILGAILSHLASGKRTTPDMLAVLHISAHILSRTLPS